MSKKDSTINKNEESKSEIIPKVETGTQNKPEFENQNESSITAIIFKSSIHSKTDKNVFVFSTEEIINECDSNGYIQISGKGDFRFEDMKDPIKIRIFPDDLKKLQEILK